MMKHNAANERIKRKYLIFLKEAKRQNVSSIDAVAKALSRFEEYTKYRDFKAFNDKQAVGFKHNLAKQKNQSTGKNLSKATLNTTLRQLKTFFQWLYLQTGYKSYINYTDTEYFNLSEKETRIATAKRNKPVPTLEQIKHVINSMPFDSEIEKRNRAVIAFTILTGARDSAIASFKIKHIDLNAETVLQDAREVKTKFSKTFTSYFFPVGDNIRSIVIDWVKYLKEELLFGNDDPLFPKTNMINNKNKKFEASGLKREHWSNATPIRKIFKDAFTHAELDYFNPHSFRNTLVTFSLKICKSPEEIKSVSQSLGHESVLTTFISYGEVQPQRQAEIFQQLKEPLSTKSESTDEIIKATIKEMRNQKMLS